MGIRSWFGGRGADPQPEEVKEAVNVNVLERIGGWSGGISMSGASVSEASALQVTAVLACLTRVASDIASFPLHVKRRNDDGTDFIPVRSNLYRLLHSRPNPLFTSSQFVGMMTAQGMLHGEAFAFIVKNAIGEPLELWPLQKSEVGVERRGFEIFYDVSAYEGAISGRYTSNEIFHLRPLSMDGVHGLSRLHTARNNIGLALAVQGTQSKSYKNGGRMPGYWTTSDVLGADQVALIEKQLQASNSDGNQWKSPLVDSGIDYKTTGMTFEDAQLIETRKHEILEVCAMFGVLPAVLGIDDKTQAFASVEAMFRAHLSHTLRPWLVSWEQSLDRDILDGQGPLFAKFDTSDMEKATTKERAESYGTLMQNLVLMPSEARAKEGLPPIKGIDEVWMQVIKGKNGLADSAGASQEGSANDSETE